MKVNKTILKLLSVFVLFLSLSGCGKKAYSRTLTEAEKEVVGQYYNFAVGQDGEYVGVSVQTAKEQKSSTLVLSDTGMGILKRGNDGASFIWTFEDEVFEIEFINKSEGDKKIARQRFYCPGVIDLVFADDEQNVELFFGKEGIDDEKVLTEIGAVHSSIVGKVDEVTSEDSTASGE